MPRVIKKANQCWVHVANEFDADIIRRPSLRGSKLNKEVHSKDTDQPISV